MIDVHEIGYILIITYTTDYCKDGRPRIYYKNAGGYIWVSKRNVMKKAIWLNESKNVEVAHIYAVPIRDAMTEIY